MSSVRMCDACGNIFSERADGWVTATGTRMQRDEKGVMRSIAETIDTGPCCTGSLVVQPRVALTASGGVDRIATTQNQAERDTLLGG